MFHQPSIVTLTSDDSDISSLFNYKNNFYNPYKEHLNKLLRQVNNNIMTINFSKKRIKSH